MFKYFISYSAKLRNEDMVFASGIVTMNVLVNSEERLGMLMKVIESHAIARSYDAKDIILSGFSLLEETT